MKNFSDVPEAEETAPSSSDENNTADQAPETDSEVVKTPEVEESDEAQKTVPYDRFQEVVKQRNTYKELLDTSGSGSEKTAMSENDVRSQAQELADRTGESYDDALKIVREIVDKQDSKKRSSSAKNTVDGEVSEQPMGSESGSNDELFEESASPASTGATAGEDPTYLF